MNKEKTIYNILQQVFVTLLQPSYHRNNRVIYHKSNLLVDVPLDLWAAVREDIKYVAVLSKLREKARQAKLEAWIDHEVQQYNYNHNHNSLKPLDESQEAEVKEFLHWLITLAYIDMRAESEYGSPTYRLLHAIHNIPGRLLHTNSSNNIELENLWNYLEESFNYNNLEEWLQEAINSEFQRAK